MLGDAPCKQEVIPFRVGWLFLRDDFHVGTRHEAPVLILHEKPARDGFHEDASGMRVSQTNGQKKAQVFLFAENLFRFIVRARRDHDFGKDLGDFCSRFAGQRTVQRDNTAKGRGAVAVIRLFIGFERGSAERHAARIGMFDDRDSRVAIGRKL